MTERTSRFASVRQDKADEDYVRSIILSFSEAGLSETGTRIRDQTGTRAFQKDPRLQACAKRDFHHVTLRTSGVVLPKKSMAISVDWDAVERVAIKWIRGLFWKDLGRRLPSESTFNVAMRSPSELNEDFHYGRRSRLRSGPVLEWLEGRTKPEPPPNPQAASDLGA